MKKWKGVLAVALAMALIPVSNFKAFAEEAEVKERSVRTQEEFKEAIEAKVPTINITEDIQLTEKLDILHDVTINGQGKKLYYTLEDNTVWESKYALQFYQVNAVLSNITLEGGNAGILVNGSHLQLKGDIEIKNVGNGGIELSKGDRVVKEPKIDLTESKLTYVEEDSKPALWLDNIELKEDTIKRSLPVTYNAIPVGNNKTYVSFVPYAVTSEETLRQAVEKGYQYISIDEDFELKNKVNFLNDVRIIGNGKTLTGNKEGESNLYAFHFYKVNQAFVSDLNFENMDAALLVNGSNVTLLGTIDVSNNKFGGIELSKGSGVETTPVLNLSDAKLVNETESFTQPTIWVDKNIEVKINEGEQELQSRDDVKENQTHYYLNQQHSPIEIATSETLLDLEAVLKSLASEDLRVTIDEKTKAVLFTKLNAEEQFTKEELIEILSDIIGHEKVLAYELAGVSYTKESDEGVKKVLDAYLTSLVETKTRTALDLVEELNENLDLKLKFKASNDLEVLHQLDATFDKEDKVDKPVEKPTEKPVEKPVEKPKDKTPNTGISSTYTSYLMLTVMALAFATLLKAKRKSVK